MSKGRCQKFFPKPPAEETIMKKGEAPIYRRPNDGLRHAITKGRSWSATNFQVVPTNWHLLALMGCHVNVEVVASTEIPKYLFLYITKGDTRTMFVIHRPPTVVADQAAASPEEPIDEIKVRFQNFFPLFEPIRFTVAAPYRNGKKAPTFRRLRPSIGSFPINSRGSCRRSSVSPFMTRTTRWSLWRCGTLSKGDLRLSQKRNDFLTCRMTRSWARW